MLNYAQINFYFLVLLLYSFNYVLDLMTFSYRNTVLILLYSLSLDVRIKSINPDYYVLVSPGRFISYQSKCSFSLNQREKMFGLRKSPANLPKHNSVDLKSSKPNPFDSDDELDNKHTLNPSKRTTSEPSLADMTNPFHGDRVEKGFSSSSKQSLISTSKYQYKNDFRDSGGIENQSVQELEGYAVYKAEETTKSVHGCLKVAEDIRSDATRTLVMLHEQGEQITRTHHKAVEIDQDLSRVSFSSLLLLILMKTFNLFLRILVGWLLL